MIMGAWGLGRQRLPYDAEVAYLESTGTQWIITNVLPSVGDIFSIEADVQISPNYVNDSWLSGWYKSANNSSLIGVYGNSHYFTYNIDSNKSSISGFVTERVIIRYNVDGGTFVNSHLVSSTMANLTPLTTVDDRTLAIFNRSDLLPIRAIKAKVFSFKILLNGGVAFDGAPVRFTNENGQSEGAMYDRANPTVGMNPDGSPRTDGLYRNRGTGAFLWAEKQ